MNSNEDSIYSKPNPIIFLSEKQKKKKKRTKRYLVVFIVFILIFAIFVAAYSAGFIPITALMEIKEPAGNSKEINTNYFLSYFPGFSNYDILEKFKIGVFSTDASSNIVKDDYKKRLESEGYSLQHYKSEKFMGIDIKTYGYVKGLTGAGIVIFSNSNYLFDGETIVIYTAGNVLDYVEVLEENDSMISFFT